jgi:hypothetical protein
VYSLLYGFTRKTLPQIGLTIDVATPVSAQSPAQQ